MLRHYEPIARKFRPQSFQDVFEQGTIVQILKNAILHQRVSQAYLFCGTKGTGKTTLARIFAKALNCKDLSSSCEPCNKCQNCLEITSGQSLDVLEVDGASNRGIDDIRQLNETVSYLPSSSNYKIYIIDEVHMLTKEAFNALLKTLEEPPAHVKFFFATTEPHKVLPTILSRCQRFDLNRISCENIAKKLNNIVTSLGITADSDALLAVAKLADGSLRDAESLMDQILCYEKSPITLKDLETFLGLTSKESYFKLSDAIISYNLAFAYTLCDTLYTTGQDLTYFTEGLIDHFQTLLKLKLGLMLPSTLPQEEVLNYKKISPHLSESQCLYLLDELMKHLQTWSHSSFKRIHLEMLLLTLIRSSRRLPLDALVQSLEQLKSSTFQVEVPQSPIEATPKSQAPVLHEVKIQQVIEPEPMQEALVDTPSSISEDYISEEEPPQEEVLLAPLVEDTEINVEVTVNLPKETVSIAVEASPTESLEIASSEPSDMSKLHRYETIMRFASVELGGTLKKEQ